MNLEGTIQTMKDSQDRKYKIRHAVLEGAYANEGLWSLNFINLAACLPAVQETTCNAEDPGSIPGLGRCPGEGNGNPR